MNQGDIHWVAFSGGAGRAQAGHRPAVIVQNDETSQQIPNVLVVPLTTQKDALRFPGTILIDPDEHNGLKNSSVALAFQLTAIDQRFLEKRQGAVSESVLDSILSSLIEITERNGAS